MTDPFLVRLLIGALVYFLLDLLIDKVVTKPDANKAFSIILLIGVILYVLFGAFLPRIG